MDVGFRPSMMSQVACVLIYFCSVFSGRVQLKLCVRPFSTCNWQECGMSYARQGQYGKSMANLFQVGLK